MDQSFNAFLKLDEYAEVGDIGNFTFDNGTGRVVVKCCLPWIWFKLFNAKREPFVFAVNFQNYGLDRITFGIFFRRVLDAFSPGKIRDVNETVNAFFNTDKYTEIGYILDLAHNN